jgi:hypothetical protein
MTDARLKETERLEVFHLVTGAGFDSADFAWTEKRGYESFRSSMGGGDDVTVSVLLHNSTDYFMRFGAFANEFSPGVEARVDHAEHDSTWATRIQACKPWLVELRKEVDCPDLWAMAQQGRVLSDAATGDTTNLPFTPAEIAGIFTRLEELKRFLITSQQFHARESAIIDAQFRYLRDSSERMGRKDWFNIAFSVLISVVVSVALPPENAKALLEMAGALFGGLIQSARALLF